MPKVRIYKPHTHAGRRYTPGADGIEIEVSQLDADYLQRAGVTTRPEATAPAKAEPPAAAANTGRTGLPPPAVGK